MSETDIKETAESKATESGTTSVLEAAPATETPSQVSGETLPEKNESARMPEIQRIMKLQVPIIVRLAEKVLPVGEITQLVPGAIIEFNKTVGEPLDLMINNKLIGNGQAVKVGEKFGLRITKLNSLEQVIKAMGM